MTENLDNNNVEDILNTITNENGERKYKDVSVAIKALSDSQNYIKELQQQLDYYKNDNTDVEELKKKVESQQLLIEKLMVVDNNVVQPNVAEGETKLSLEDENNNNGVDIEAVVNEKVKIALEALQKQDKETKNYNTVLNYFGTEENLTTSLTKASEDLGMSQEELITLSKHNPNVFLKLVGAGINQPNQNTNIQGNHFGSSVNTNGIGKNVKTEPPKVSIFDPSNRNKIEQVKALYQHIAKEHGIEYNP